MISQSDSTRFVPLKSYLFGILLCLLFLFPAKSHGQFFNSEDSFIENTGDALFVFLPVSAVTTSFLLKDKKGAWQFTKSFALNLAVTGAMKVLINKERPLQGGDHAFPSGHTSVVFQSASFYHRRYGFKYSIPAYVLAGFTAYSRLNAKRHDGWDILAGAVVGIGSTWIFTKPYQEERMQFTFSGYNDVFVLGFKYDF